MSIKTVRARKKEKLSELKDIIVNSILDKKGEDVVCLDLRKTEDAVTDFFVICHATSKVQVKAIADHIIENTKEHLNELPYNKEGFQNFEWVLIDYVNVVVHIFLKEKRAFYQLEDLWNDAVRTDYD